MGRDEPLKGLHSSQPLHGAFPSSEGQVAVLCAIVEPAAYFLSISVSQLLHRRTIGAETVRDNDARGAVTLQRFLQELQRRGLVPPRGHEGFRHLALRVDRVPEVAAFTVHAHEDLVQMPTPVGVLAQGLDPPRADRRGEHRAEPVHPKPRSFVADVDAALEGQVFDIPQ